MDDESSIGSGVSLDSYKRPGTFSGLLEDIDEEDSTTKDDSTTENDRSVAESAVGVQETRWVQGSKGCAFLVLALAAAGGAIGAYKILKREDVSSMAKQVRKRKHTSFPRRSSRSVFMDFISHLRYLV